VQRGDELLLQHRAAWSHEGGTWAVPGGALDLGETSLEGALREAAEEAAVGEHSIRPRHAWTVDHGTWAYTTVVADAVGPITPQRLDAESEELRWVRVADVTRLPLHSGFAAAWPSVQPLLRRHEVVVVDAANVVGSVPTGWWNDRAGAAQRLLDAVSSLALDGVDVAGADDGDSRALGASLLPEVAGRTQAWPRWVVVLEGEATAAADQPGVQVERAGGSGDDAVVESARHARAAGRQVTVVTADRALRQRVETLGARVVGPRALTQKL
jgi:8-oxo-dGTP pyrophosphatase MutT (NUDIX family)